MEKKDYYQSYADPEIGSSKKRGKGSPFKYILCVLLGIVIAVVPTWLYLGSIFTHRSSSEGICLDEFDNDKLSEICDLIDGYYYGEIDDEKMADGVYKGVVESLEDPYSVYYTAEEYESMLVSFTGNYAGIGALLSQNLSTGEVTVSKVYEDSPAEKAGLKEADVITKADDFSSEGVDLETFVQHIRGEAGSKVTLTIVRDGETSKLVCTRENISVPSVEYQMLDNNIGYIEISQFVNDTAGDFKDAIKDLQKQGMEKVIFDLRGNGGGLVDSVTEMLDYILPKGTTVYTMDKNGERTDFDSDEATKLEIPMVVLVDENTASAAEIFTGAIRDFEYGTIIGTNTFGKGIVQSSIPLTDGSALKITTQKYYTPSGECIHGKGIAPDIELELDIPEDEEYSIEIDNQIKAAKEVLMGTYEPEETVEEDK